MLRPFGRIQLAFVVVVVVVVVAGIDIADFAYIYAEEPWNVLAPVGVVVVAVVVDVAVDDDVVAAAAAASVEALKSAPGSFDETTRV